MCINIVNIYIYTFIYIYVFIYICLYIHIYIFVMIIVMITLQRGQPLAIKTDLLVPNLLVPKYMHI